MKYYIESVRKQDMQFLKDNIKSRVTNTKVFKRSNKAIIEWIEPYLVNELTLINKSKAKKEIQNIINELRQFQFNN